MYSTKPLVTTRPIPYLHHASSVLMRSPLELLSVLLEMYSLHKCIQQAFLMNYISNNFVKIYSEKIITVCNAVYFRLCIDLMHITPPVIAQGFDGSHHPRYAEWYKTRHSKLSIYKAILYNPFPNKPLFLRGYGVSLLKHCRKRRNCS